MRKGKERRGEERRGEESEYKRRERDTEERIISGHPSSAITKALKMNKTPCEWGPISNTLRSESCYAKYLAIHQKYIKIQKNTKK